MLLSSIYFSRFILICVVDNNSTIVTKLPYGEVILHVIKKKGKSEPYRYELKENERKPIMMLLLARLMENVFVILEKRFGILSIK